MLKVQSLVSSAAEAAHRTAAVETYTIKALDLIASQLPVWAAMLPEAAQRRVITDTYERSKQLGFKTEADHLRYLVAVFFLGSHFTSDYQFFDDLHLAGWVDEKPHKPSLARLCHQIDLYQAAVADDVASRQRVMRTLVELCRQAPRAMSVSLVHEACWQVWPSRTNRMRAEVMPLWIDAAGQTAHDLGISGVDVLLHSVLAMYFGHRFYEDPLYPWAVAAYQDLSEQDDATRDNWRLQLLSGAKKFFDNKCNVRVEVM